ncbi:uncharacterized protein BT62DRAFT_935135 [Guyanagaster necrorhizus]|uniref:Zn(2)-C6 fungal-type domain-containing protein n=1 Tax=Guyanagaster necrorhizus TaxID=856835 RepID=A0A9P7VN06_9AGAR|nr:uncharacterized protein BT62DRAFT_935135 [Guyanagaster necrorhizus MCA 3950]KAG7443528.1 hypothetical protein BT62DRAFT_935135 [Guyanagaster necrorhizus MCA 3950]
MLPSIRQLHPYLPSSAGEGEGESGGDEPKKKKRRRQALSCTECKRRKIRCDRNQPCAPCVRRGEQSKCLWNVVEPAEKYATRAEYDELKARVEHLEALVERLTQSQAQSQSQAQAQPHPQPGPPPPFISPPPQPKNWAALTFLVLGGRQRCSRPLGGTPAPDPPLTHPISRHIHRTRPTHIPARPRRTRLTPSRVSHLPLHHLRPPYPLRLPLPIHRPTRRPHLPLGAIATPRGDDL